MAMSSSSELPLCPICCDWLGKYGGPSTLPCGHNGCLDCFVHVQSCSPQCPLCRQGFDPALRLACNHELRDLIALATAALMDDKTRDEGWEAFPTAKVTNEHYAAHMASQQQQQQQQLQAPLSFQGCYGPTQQQPQQQPQPPPGGWHHYPAVPPGAPPRHGGGSSSGGGGGTGAVIAGSSRPPAGALPQQQQQQQQQQGLGALLDGGGSSAGGGRAVVAGGAQAAHHQFHGGFHAHPGLPTSAPSGTTSDILHWEPPQWLPDSYAPSCCGCHQPFKPLLRLRHHCRLCGKIFCDACTTKRMLLPPRFRERAPQRCCELCSSLLSPLQPFLTAATSAAQQPPVHDALDAVSLRSWLNNPWGACMADELYKGANILRAFCEALRPELERRLPCSLLAGGVRGLALLSVARLGAGWSCTAGTGLVVSRQRNGGWSAPCAISCYGLGWGFAFGGQLTDVLLVLRTDEAVRAFAAGKTLGLGGACGLALGPLGRSAEASMRLGGLAARGAVLGYSCSRGAFAGLSLEGSLTSVRHAVNRAFYGQAVTPQQLLVDCSLPAPPAAALLYTHLQQLTALWESRGALVRGATPAKALRAAPSSSCAAAAMAADAVAVGSCKGVPSCASSSAAAATGMAGSSAGSSASREWDLVGSFAAADALEQFDDSVFDEDDDEGHQQQHGGGGGRFGGFFGRPQQQQQQHGSSTSVGLVTEHEVAGAAAAAAGAAAGGAAGAHGSGGGADDDMGDDADEFLASAPPAPTSVLFGLLPGGGGGGGGGSSVRAQPPQRGSEPPAYRVQEPADEEDEEPQYVLEW